MNANIHTMTMQTLVFSTLVVKIFTMLVQHISTLTFAEWHQTQSTPEANGYIISFDVWS